MVEVWTTLAALARETSRVRLGQMVTGTATRCRATSQDGLHTGRHRQRPVHLRYWGRLVRRGLERLRLRVSRRPRAAPELVPEATFTDYEHALVTPRLSPDGRRILVGFDVGSGVRPQIVDIASKTVTSLGYHTGEISGWSPDAARVLLRGGYLPNTQPDTGLRWALTKAVDPTVTQLAGTAGATGADVSRNARTGTVTLRTLNTRVVFVDGLVKHLSIVEAWYAGETFGRPFPEHLPWCGEMCHRVWNGGRVRHEALLIRVEVGDLRRCPCRSRVVELGAA